MLRDRIKFKCEVCGKVTENKRHNPKAKYCGKKCAHRRNEIRRRQIYELDKEAGFCTICGGPRDAPNRITCSYCRLKGREDYLKYKKGGIKRKK